MAEFTRRTLLFAAGGLAAWRPALAQLPSRPQILRGSAMLDPPQMMLRAGSVTLEFEPALAFVRYVRLGEAEVLRGIYAAVRDSTWLTVLPKVTNIAADVRERSFRLTFDADCTEGGISFLWRGTITGDEAGTIRFAMDGAAKTTFNRNRIGFCVLHPLEECVGKPYTAETAAGATVRGNFPEHISPHQPVKDLRAITHTVAAGVEAEVRFEGDIFEMEDHRNWTDGNFKTYCTPLALPFPVEVKQGTQIRQSIAVTLKGRPSAVAISKSVEIRMERAGTAASKLPAIGAMWSPMDSAQKALLKKARVRHLRVDLRLGEDYSQQLQDAARDAAAIGASLEIAVFLTNNAEAELKALVARVPFKPARWLIFHVDESSTSEKWLVLARKLLKGAPVGGGTDQYFTELNRQRPKSEWLDFACYSLNPQVHAFDDRSLVENLQPQAATVQSAKAFLGGTPIAVTPVTLRPRFNPQAKVKRFDDPQRFDYRQPSLFGAAWTVGSIKYLAEAGVNSVTYYEATGPGGWIGSGAFPLYHVLAAVGTMTGADVIPMRTSDPLRAVALLLRQGGQARLLVANLTLEPQIVRIARLPFEPQKQLAIMDEHSYPAFASVETVIGRGDLSIGLLPYAVARIDGKVAE